MPLRYCDPIYGVNGVHDYPYSMRSTLPYMPKFSDEEKSLLKAYKPDAFGLNHYGTSFVAYDGGNPAANQSIRGACIDNHLNILKGM